MTAAPHESGPGAALPPSKASLRESDVPAVPRLANVGPPRLRVAVVGGGITGLACAHRLAESGGGTVDVSIVEASDQLGGVIRTERAGDLLLEGGPDSFVTDKPEAVALAQRLGLGDELIPTQDRFRRTLVAQGDRLVPLPDAFQLLAPARIGPFLRTPLLTWRGKLTALRDLIAPRGGPPPGDDESLASFVRRRLGQEMLDRIAQPMVGGIYTADPEKLSLASTMPRFLEIERRQRSLILGLMRQAAATPAGTSGARFGLFATLRRGVASLVEALAATLPPESVRLRTPVLALDRAPGAGPAWTLGLGGGESLAVNAVVLALPTRRSAEILRRLDGELAHDLAAIPYASTAIVTLAYRRADVPRPLDAFGFVVPEIERRRIVACSFSSVKYAGRAPEDRVLLRVFVGGSMHPELFALDDAAMVEAVRAELRSLLGIAAEPLLVRIGRWPESMPQYEVGHAGRVARIRARAAVHAGLFLAGNGYEGVGLSDCIRSGEGAAAAALDFLAGSLGGRLAVPGAHPATGARS